MPKPHAEVIKELSVEDISGLQPWEMLAAAIPRGKRRRVAEIIGEQYSTLTSWCNDPEATDGGHEAHGRRGTIHDFLSLLLAVHAQCPEGAALIAKWVECQLAEADAIQGRDKLKAALRVADEMRALADQMIAIAGGPARNKT